MRTHAPTRAVGRRRGDGRRSPADRRAQALAPTATLAMLATLATTFPARAAPEVEPTAALSVDGAYDSNVFNGRGPDYVTRVTPRLALRIHDLRVDFDAAYDLGLWFYAEGTAENSINHQGEASLQARLTRRLTVRLADEIIYARDPGFLLRAGVVAPQTSIFDNTAEGALDYRLSRRFGLGLSYSYRHTTFGAPPPGAAPLFDGDQHDALATLGFRAGPLDDLRLGDRFSYFTADGVGLAIADSPSLGWRHQLFPWLELRLESGPLFYRLLDSGQPFMAQAPGTGSGTTWRGAGLLRFVSPHWRASLALTRDLVGGTGAASVLWADFLTAQVGYRIERRLDVRASAGVFANGYAPDVARAYDGVTADTAVDVVAWRGLHAAGYYSFRWQEAPNADAMAPLPQVTRHIVGLRVSGVWGGEALPPRHPAPPD